MPFCTGSVLSANPHSSGAILKPMSICSFCAEFGHRLVLTVVLSCFSLRRKGEPLSEHDSAPKTNAACGTFVETWLYTSIKETGAQYGGGIMSDEVSLKPTGHCRRSVVAVMLVFVLGNRYTCNE